jgi:uncharacterized protein (DUF2141 family)
LLSSTTLAGSLQTGKVRVVSAADVANGNYSPISMSYWGGGYSYPAFQGVGGKWNGTSNPTFTVTAAVAGTAGTPVPITPSGANQRVLISDNTAGTATGIGFLSTESALTVTGSTLTGPPLSVLTGLLPSGESVLDGWMYSTTGGYLAGDPAYLSLSLASAYSAYTRGDLGVWDFNGGTWSQFAADDLTFDGSYASFTATALNGYDYAIVGIPLGVHNPGDANGDGKVDINDLTIVLSDFGRSGMVWSTGDFNGDGKVDVNDLTIVLSHFGQSYGASAAALAAVPEPSAIAIAAAAALLGLVACAWKRRG